jgi:hypothetical protein
MVSRSALTCIVLVALATSPAHAGEFCGFAGKDSTQFSPSEASHHVHSHQKIELGVTGNFTQCGFRISSVACHSVAEQLGLEPGDIIVRINSRNIDCSHALQQGLRDASSTGYLTMQVEDVRHHHMVTVSASLFDRIPEFSRNSNRLERF